MRTLALVNQKGGCGKTTAAVNLAGALAARGQRVALVDLDPQAHATLALSVAVEPGERSIADVLLRGVSVREARRRSSARRADRKSTRLNSSHSQISYAVFCLKKKNKQTHK